MNYCNILKKTFIMRTRAQCMFLTRKYTSALFHKGMTGGQIINKKLKQHRVNTVFGYSGGAVLPLLDTFYKDKIKFITNSNEQCCGHAAEGYAKVSGNPGIIVTTSGPGVTNLITPLQDAMSDGVPIIAFTGQVSSEFIGTHAFQECPAIELTKPCTKWNYQVKTLEEIPEIIDKAFNIALEGRMGPVHIDLPKDILSSSLKNDLIKYKIGPKYHKARKVDNDIYNDIDDNTIQNLIKLINNAKSPILYVGQGCNDYSQLLTEFAIKANIPVTTTLHGLGCFNEKKYPHLSLKMVGMHGSAYANYAIQNADLILGFGARFDDRTIGNAKKYALKAIKAGEYGIGGIISVNINEIKIGITAKPCKEIIMDVGYMLAYILSGNYGILKYKERNEWFSQINQWKKNHPFMINNDKNNRIKDQNVIKSIDKFMKDDSIITTGVGNHQMFTCQFITWRNSKTMVSSGSLGTMGTGLPYAIGAKIAMSHRDVICIDGDGSFNMTNVDLRTIAEYNIPVKIAIMNNNRQQMVHIWQDLFFNKNFISTSHMNPDYNKLAEAYGIKSLYCDNLTNLDNIVKEFINYDGPILVNFKTVPDICLPLVAPGKALDEMILSDKDINLDGSDAPC
jgi:acetolactate synthase-1/2/3 large subunit